MDVYNDFLRLRKRARKSRSKCWVNLQLLKFSDQQSGRGKSGIRNKDAAPYRVYSIFTYPAYLRNFFQVHSTETLRISSSIGTARDGTSPNLLAIEPTLNLGLILRFITALQSLVKITNSDPSSLMSYSLTLGPGLQD